MTVREMIWKVLRGETSHDRFPVASQGTFETLFFFEDEREEEVDEEAGEIR